MTTQTGRGARQNLWSAVIEGINTPMFPKAHEPLSDRLLRIVTFHVESEEASLAEYRRLHDETEDPAIESLMGLVLDDEQHHHAMFRRMAEQFEYEMGPTRKGATLPTAPPKAGVDADPVSIAKVKKLARLEALGAKRLRQIAKQNPELHAGLFALLLETMMMDSKKHEHILKYVAKRMEEAAAAA